MNENQEEHFKEIKTRTANATENGHFNPDFEIRINCDASRRSLGAALEKLTHEDLQTIVFESEFLNELEERYIIKELELLGDFLSIAHFKYYHYARAFQVITDHISLFSIMREHRPNKSYNSRLVRLIDRLLPLDSTIDQLLGSKRV